MRYYLGAIVCALVAADMLVTDQILARGGVEANPLAWWLMTADLFVAAKIISAATLVGIAWVTTQTVAAERILTAATFMLTVVVAFNLYQLIGAA